MRPGVTGVLPPRRVQSEAGPEAGPEGGVAGVARVPGRAGHAAAAWRAHTCRVDGIRGALRVSNAHVGIFVLRDSFD